MIHSILLIYFCWYVISRIILQILQKFDKKDETIVTLFILTPFIWEIVFAFLLVVIFLDWMNGNEPAGKI